MVRTYLKLCVSGCVSVFVTQLINSIFSLVPHKSMCFTKWHFITFFPNADNIKEYRITYFFFIDCYNFHYLKRLIWSNFTATVVGGTCASEKILWCLGQCWWYPKWNNISEKLWKIPKKFLPAQRRKKQMVHYSRQYERWVGSSTPRYLSKIQ